MGDTGKNILQRLILYETNLPLNGYEEHGTVESSFFENALLLPKEKRN